jgi:hypothetical protein
MLSSTFPTVASKEVSMRQKLAVLTTFCLFIVPAIYAQGGQLPGPAKSPLNVSLQATQLESWTELALDKSGLPPSQFDAVLLGKYETPDYVREYWRVQWRPADPIDVYIVLPHGVSRPRAILYVYDYRFDTERFRSDVWCKAATQGGFAAVGFTSALSLQRQHTPRPMKEWFVSELQEALATSTHDVQMILNFLEKRGDIDATQVAMYGQGSGGTIAILAAAVDPRIVALDLLNPWGDWPDWLKDSPQIPDDERSTYLQPAFLQKVANLDPVDYLPRLTLKGLRIQQITDDLVTPDSAKKGIDAVVPRSATVVRYDGVDAHMAAWRRDGLNGWIRGQLRPAPAPASAGQ